jgi:hypothetical protein
LLNLAHGPLKATLLGADKKISYYFSKGKCVINPVSIYPNLPSGGYAWVIKLENAL